MKIDGTSVVNGIAIGKAQIVDGDHKMGADRYAHGDITAELKKYTKASNEAKHDLEAVLKNEGLSDSETQILHTHIALLEDFAFTDAITSYINDGCCTPDAINKAVAETETMFLSLEDSYLRERAADLRDVGSRLLRALLGIRDVKIKYDAAIICAQDIAPSLMAAMPKTKLKGVILGHASQTSHAVIIAKSKGCVTVVGVDVSPFDIQDGDTLILDADTQQLIINPPKGVLNRYRLIEAEQWDKKARRLKKAKLPAITPYGKEIVIAANISQPCEVEDIARFGCQGVGLFRTEFLYMHKKQFPTEEEQFEAYKYVVQNAKGRLCVIRTLDIGGDKPWEALHTEKEANPFLGWRAIRICLQNKELFKRQIKAILRAGAFGKAAMMIPMVISLNEITQTKQIVAEAMAELEIENKPYEKKIPIGIMVETPAAVMMAPVLAAHVDFFSIGTNDLVQYTLAVDRQNHKISDLYDDLHPAVIRAVHQTVQAAHRRNIWVGICGEMASDVLSIPLILAMDVDELSVAASAAPAIKEMIRHTKRDACDLNKVFDMTDAQDIRRYLTEIKNEIVGLI